jgi:hypothetical protein
MASFVCPAARKTALCRFAAWPGAAFLAPWALLWITPWQGKQKFDDFHAKQRLTTKGAATYKPRLPENAGTTSSVDMLR